MQSKVMITAAWMMISLLLSSSGVMGQASDPRSTVEGTISSLIEKLKARAYTEVVRDFEAPDDLSQLEERTTIDQVIASRVKKGDFDRLLAACEHASQVKPKLSTNGALAVFEYVGGDGKKATFGLKRVGNRWYLM